MCVFVSITDLRPDTKCKLDIVNGETDVPVVTMEGPIPKEVGPTAICDMVFHLENLVFPEPGTYFVRFFGNEHPLLQRPVEVLPIGEEKKDV